ncbi:Stp1/IreP family PP2C-type Ser/Thr phosphatase [Oceanobacillus massiliensis]|uniref:Stp1/IreP family PP2C-type Ser/Thr phosphatase n=2 Tax=Oceanobacillus massiliensis TaxID=1465765 RepID=UPI0002888FB6|nr:Stp1/IreP family PP2C-type Ser/Thr phosphatase [Oceanobacillus massiliensis]
MEGHFLTDRGQVRSHNEDSGGIFYNSNQQLLAVIADGMGGHQAGDVASQLAIDLVRDKWLPQTGISSPEKIETWLSNTVSEVNHSIYEYSLKNKECEGMGTTIVIAICLEEFVTIAHVGDSRCYILNENGFKQITNDHSLVNELVRSGQISEDDAEQHPRKNVLLKAMGTETNVSEDILTVEWEAGDRLLLCSDGLSNKLNDEDLAAFIREAKDLGDIGSEMIELANERGGEDNISLILVQHDSSLKAGENE